MEDCTDYESFSLNSSLLRLNEKHERVVVHIDIDCFYAQVEMILNPSLCGKPVGIQQKNLVVTCNYEARSLGVEKLMSVKQAQQICPGLVLVLGEDLKKYREMSEQIYQVLQTFCPFVEKLGLDENFIDVTELVSNLSSSAQALVGHIYKSEDELCQCGCKTRLFRGSIIAQEMRNKLKEELGITCCAGIAHNKLLAKLVGATHKPNQQSTVLPASCLALIESLTSPRNIPGIGSSTFKKLDSLEINTVKKLQVADILVLTRLLGEKTANQIQQLSFGIDERQVKITDKPKSIGAEDGFPTATTVGDIRVKMKLLLRRVWILIEKDGRKPSQVKLTVRKIIDHPSKHSIRESRQTVLDPTWLAGIQKLVPLNPAQEAKILTVLVNLFDKIVANSTSWLVTLIGISFSGLPTDSPPKNTIQKYFAASGSSSEDVPRNSIRKFVGNSLSSKPDEEPPVKRMRINCIDQSVLSELPLEIRNEVMAEMERQSSSQQSKGEAVDPRCPQGVDNDVFRQLPTDIQEELIASHRKDDSKAKTISQYFRKL